MQQNDGSSVIILFYILILVAFFVIYWIPSIVAFNKGHPNRWVIFVINTVFGGTGIGWLGALVWAMQAIHLGQTSHGGESGLNIFDGDVKKVSLVSSVAPQSIATEIEKLKKLLDEGTITESEFQALKDRILK